MTCLNDFDCVREKLRTNGRAAVVALHKFIFEGEGDRDNRQRLLEFDGFADNDEKYKTKKKYVEENLSAADLVCICNLLDIDYNADNLFEHIYMNLRVGQLLCTRSVDDVDDEDDDHDDGDNDALENTIVQNNNRQTTAANNMLEMCAGGTSGLTVDAYQHNDGGKRQAIPNEEYCLYSRNVLRRKDDLINYNDGNMQQRRNNDYNDGYMQQRRNNDYNDGYMQQRRNNDYNDGYMQQRRNNDFNDGNMKQRRVSNLNDYNDDDGRQTLRRHNNFYDYNDGYMQQTTRRGFTMSLGI